MALAIDLVRAGQDAAAVLLFGSHAFRLAVAQPALPAGAPGGPGTKVLGRTPMAAEAAGLAVVFMSAPLWLLLEAADMGGRSLDAAFDQGLLGSVLLETSFGHVMLWRLIAAALVGILLIARSRSHPSGTAPLDGVGLIVSGALLANMAWVSHAGATGDGTGLWLVAVDALHLLAVGAWLGALPSLAILLLKAGRAGSSEALRLAGAAAQRFSFLGLASVAVLVATGLVNFWFLVGDLPALIGTRYGRLLLVKLGLFLLMLSLAWMNRYRLAPQVGARSKAGRAALAALARNTLLEVLVGLGLLGVVGMLVNATPAAHEQPVWPLPVRLDLTGLVVTPWLESLFITAAILFVGGAVGALLGVRRRSGWTVLAGLVLMAAGLALPRDYLLVEAYPTSFFRSPARYEVGSIARGETLYAAHCASCHGVYGYGDGPLASTLSERPADLTAHLTHHGEGTLFWWVSQGIPGTPMPGFADRLDDDQRWDLINFLRAQADAEGANGKRPEVEPFRPVVAPDFAFQIGGGPQETLAAQRGKAIVLLVLYRLPESQDRLAALARAAPELARRGVRAIAFPLAPSPSALPALTGPGAEAILAAPEGGVSAAYGLFRRVPTGEGVLPEPVPIEFLIDRAGYLRARWIASEEGGWTSLAVLFDQVARLNAEPARPPAPEGHVH